MSTPTNVFTSKKETSSRPKVRKQIGHRKERRQERRSLRDMVKSKWEY